MLLQTELQGWPGRAGMASVSSAVGDFAGLLAQNAGFRVRLRLH